MAHASVENGSYSCCCLVLRVVVVLSNVVIISVAKTPLMSVNSSGDSDLFGSSDSEDDNKDTVETGNKDMNGKDEMKGKDETTNDGDLFGDIEETGGDVEMDDTKQRTTTSDDSDNNLFGESDDEREEAKKAAAAVAKEKEIADAAEAHPAAAEEEERLVNVDDDSDASSTGMGNDDDNKSTHSEDGGITSEDGSRSPRGKIHTVRVHENAPDGVFSDGKCHIVKLMPTVTGIDPIPFSRDTFPLLHAAALDKCPDEKGRAALTSRAENSIRWRFKEGSDKKEMESNARLIEWADGSLTLMVGKESFKVLKREERVYVYDKGDTNPPPGYTHNGVPVLGNVNDMSCHGLCTSQLTVTPGSLESRTHKNLARWVIRPHGSSLKGQKKKTSLTTTDEVLAAQARAEQSLEDSRFALSAGSRRKDMMGRRGMSEAFLESGMGSSSPSGARGIHSLKQQYKKRRRTMKGMTDSGDPDAGSVSD